MCTLFLMTNSMYRSTGFKFACFAIHLWRTWTKNINEAPVGKKVLWCITDMYILLHVFNSQTFLHCDKDAEQYRDTEMDRKIGKRDCRARRLFTLASLRNKLIMLAQPGLTPCLTRRQKWVSCGKMGTGSRHVNKRTRSQDCWQHGLAILVG